MCADIPSHTIPGGGTVPPSPPPCDRKEIRSSNNRYNGGKDGYFWAYFPFGNKYSKCKHSIEEQIWIYHRYNNKGCVHTFEIGSRECISPSNIANLKKLQKFCKPSVSFKAMTKIYLVLLSYNTYRKRKTLDWDQKTPFLKTTSKYRGHYYQN